ncbi:Hypothetical predicted protein, partial [Marmota monax]
WQQQGPGVKDAQNHVSAPEIPGLEGPHTPSPEAGSVKSASQGVATALQAPGESLDAQPVHR